MDNFQLNFQEQGDSAQDLFACSLTDVNKIMLHMVISIYIMCLYFLYGP